MNSSRNHALSHTLASRRFAASIAAACILGLGATTGAVVAAPAAHALPGGMSVEDARAAISAPISVPAGQTTTVSLPVAANASYSGDGWSVSTSGSTVTITAPPEGGQISVPVTAQGQSATITLVAEGGASGGNTSGGGTAGGDTPVGSDGSGGGTGGGATSSGAADNGSTPGSNGGGNADGSDGTGASDDENTGTGDVSGSQNASLPAVPGEKPERQAAEQLDESTAERIELESTIEGNTIKAQLGLRQALDFYNQFGNLDQEQFTLRYVDADGNIIQDIKRDIDAASRTLTLTYPEGQAPDNPFYMQLVRNDGTGIEVIVSLTDPNYQRAGEEAQNASATSTSSDDEGSNLLANGVIGLGIVILLIIIGFIIRKVSNRRKQDQYEY
ncbi:hypothetical protein [Corynebacterium stationis]|uniref:hypothetical protein n=1 Tax=Corynebacterium stationis TaxID=1705 RepID=UPI001CD20C7E|nr:hypothetical protein [Corynebacterium stationis]